MSDLVFFVSPGRIKRDTALGSTVDEDVIRPYIQVAQDRHIWPALGSALYDRLRAAVKGGAGVPPLTADESTLLNDFIQPCLTQFVFMELAYVMRLRFSNNSITIANSEVGTSASIADIKLVKEQTESIATFYRERLVTYLCDKSELYPEYRANNGFQLDPSSRNYSQNINVYPRKPISNQAKAFLQAIGANPNY